MKNDLTEIAFILDRSGSMAPLREQAVSAFNSFLADQQAAPGHARISLVLFDDEYLLPIDNLPVAEAVPLTVDTYEPRGMTALLDAIGRTIDSLGQRLANTPEADRPGSVIVAIFTDGLENASKNFDLRDVSERIKRQTEEYQWEFLFLGANQDAIATAGDLNIPSRNSSSWKADGLGVRSTGSAMSTKAMALRKMAAGDLSEETALYAAKPMTEMVDEEDRKLRGEQSPVGS